MEHNPSPTTSSEQRVLSVIEFCHLYGIGKTRLYREIAMGRLPISKCGRRTLIARAEAERWFRDLPKVNGRTP